MRKRRLNFQIIFRGLVIGIAVLILANIILALLLANCALDLTEVIRQCSLQ